MKLNRAWAMLALLSSQSLVFAAGDLPSDYSLDCWDGTFFYNQLKVEVSGDRLNFVSSGQELEAYRNLLRSPAEDGWGSLSVSFSTPLKDCHVSATDAKILGCQSDLLSLTVKGTIGSNVKIDEKIEIKSASVRVRKISEVGSWGNESSGYELVLLSRGEGTATLITQRYYFGLERDETANCKLKD